MPRKIYKAKEILTKLRQVEVLTVQGRTVAEASRLFDSFSLPHPSLRPMKEEQSQSTAEARAV